MKKLMMMAAVACAASFASAAQIAWRPATSAYTVDGAAANGNAVILVLSNSGDINVTWADGKMKVTGGTVVGYGSLGSDGKNTSSLTSDLSGDWSKGTYTAINGTETITADFNANDYYEVIFNTASITEASKWQLGTSLLDKKASKATGTLALNFGGTALSSENWTNIPEPCTVALLALGMGALALRRKQR